LVLKHADLEGTLPSGFYDVGPPPSSEFTEETWTLFNDMQWTMDSLGHLYLRHDVDNFNRFLTDVLLAFYRKYPERVAQTADKSETIGIKELARFASIEEVIQHLGERKVDSLSYKGLGAVVAFFEKLGLVLFPSETRFETMRLLIEYRNALVHNYGIVNHTFKQRLPSHPAPVGAKISFTLEQAKSATVFLMQTAIAIDKRARAHWKLEGDGKFTWVSFVTQFHGTYPIPEDA